MRQAAEKGNCVIVGRCADVVLKGRARCLRIFLHAPLEYRVQRLMRTEGFEEKKPAVVCVKPTVPAQPTTSTIQTAPGVQPGIIICVSIPLWEKLGLRN